MMYSILGLKDVMFIYDFVFVGNFFFLCSNKIQTPTDIKLLFDVSKIELVVSWGGKRGTELQGHKQGMKKIYM